ncbi:MAG: DinB family protein [Candidatus Acidiferrales bacterium]
MKKFYFFALAIALVASGGVIRAFAQDSQSASSADKTPPSYDLKPQALEDLKDLQRKFVDLAGAIPADKYTWRPAEGVRSISEVFLHVSGAGYSLAPMMGAQPSPGFQAKDFEKSTTDKAKVIEQLNHSFEYVYASLEKLSNDDLKKPVKEFGPDASAGDVVYLIVTHAHEHLGQSIAYARINGVIPPWTVAAAAKAKEKEKEKPKD